MELPIIIEKIVYRKEGGLFSILACSLNPFSSIYKPELEDVLTDNISLNNYNNFTVTTEMLNSQSKLEGGQFICIGDFVKNPKYGVQFKASFIYPDIPTNEDSLKAFLCIRLHDEVDPVSFGTPVLLMSIFLEFLQNQK